MTPEQRPSTKVRLIAGLVVAVLAAFGFVRLGENGPDAGALAPTVGVQSGTRTLVVRGPNGPTDLAPTLERIESGVRDEHRNDGEAFQNRERRLPARARDYYREYVHRTVGESGPGPQRVVIGRDGDVWYTPDHYATFRRVDWTFRDGVPR